MTSPRRIAVVPAYNEEPTVRDVLGKLYGYVDELVVVDDGSTTTPTARSRSSSPAATAPGCWSTTSTRA